MDFVSVGFATGERAAASILEPRLLRESTEK